MRTYLILAHSEITADALNKCLEMAGEPPLPAGDPRRIVWEDNHVGSDAIMSAYEFLVGCIEQAAKAADGTVPRNEVVVLVDSVQPKKLSAIYEACNWENLLALLILSFPEIYWAFGALEGDEDFPDGHLLFPNEHALTYLWTKCHRNPLLDPTGLRKWVRSQTNRELHQLDDDLRLPERKVLAAAIDEETDYAYFNAYTAYRFGCRVDIVMTWAQMEEHFGGTDSEPHGYWLILEDMSLNFADKPNNVHLLKLGIELDSETKQPEGRSLWCRKLDSTTELENSIHRVLVTTGQARDDTTFPNNLAYLKGMKEGKGKHVPKPSTGIFGLWREAKLLTKPSRFEKWRNEVDFDWPPEVPETTVAPKKFLLWRRPPKGYKGHGSPGKLMLVVGTLLRRSRGILAKTDTVEAAVQGAVLATDALEMTGGRTPTSAVEALALKHHFEVLAECQFAGVAHQIDIKGRWDDIDAETENISRWFQPKVMTKAKLNARLHVLNRVIRIFREHNKFDEEQQCMIRGRNLHNTLWLMKHPWRFLFMPVLRYFELLIRSVTWFVLCLSVWVLIFGLLFKWSASYSTSWYGFFDAVTSIFAVSSPSTHQLSPDKLQVPSFYAAVVCGAIITGVAHLGVFVSHLYSIVARK